jgi:hypothetical protein
MYRQRPGLLSQEVKHLFIVDLQERAVDLHGRLQPGEDQGDGPRDDAGVVLVGVDVGEVRALLLAGGLLLHDGLPVPAEHGVGLA